jgi:hypothetical protein
LEALGGTIKLGGYIRVYNSDVTKDGEVDYTSSGTGGGYLGFMTADFGGEYEVNENSEAEKKSGIGMSASTITVVNGITTRTTKGTVKATTENAGMSYGSYYISLQDTKAVLRGNTARLVLEEAGGDPHAGLGYGGTYLTLSSSRGYLRGVSGLEFSSSLEGTAGAWMVLGSGYTEDVEAKAYTRIKSTGEFFANKKLLVQNTTAGT